MNRTTTLLGLLGAFAVAGCGGGGDTAPSSSASTGSSMSNGPGGSGGAGGAGATSSPSASSTAAGGSGPTTTGGGGSGLEPGARVDAPLGADGWVRIPGVAYGGGPSGVAVDAAGNVVVAGSVCGAIDFGAGNLGAGADCAVQSAFVAKYSPSGQLLWAKAFENHTQYVVDDVPMVAGLALDAAGDVFFAGSANGGIDFGQGELGGAYVVKLDPDGHTLFSEGFDQNGEAGVLAMAATPGGGVAVAGHFADHITVGGNEVFSDPNGGEAVFVAELDASGAAIWADAFTASHGGMGDTDAPIVWPESIAVDATGAVALSGIYTQTIDFGTGALPYASPAADDVFAFVAKLDGSGAPVFALPLEANMNAPVGANPQSLAFDGAGALYWSGTFQGDTQGGPISMLSNGSLLGNTFVVKMDVAGAVAWAEDLETQDTPSNAVGNAGGLAVDAAGDVFVAAEFEIAATPLCASLPNPPSGDSEVAVVRLDASGACTGATVVATSGLGYAQPAVLSAAAGAVALAGTFGSTVRFGATLAEGPDGFGNSMFTAKLPTF